MDRSPFRPKIVEVGPLTLPAAVPCPPLLQIRPALLNDALFSPLPVDLRGRAITRFLPEGQRDRPGVEDSLMASQLRAGLQPFTQVSFSLSSLVERGQAIQGSRHVIEHLTAEHIAEVIAWRYAVLSVTTFCCDILQRFSNNRARSAIRAFVVDVEPVGMPGCGVSLRGELVGECCYRPYFIAPRRVDARKLAAIVQQLTGAVRAIEGYVAEGFQELQEAYQLRYLQNPREHPLSGGEAGGES